jgi:hypothetical protein
MYLHHYAGAMIYRPVADHFEILLQDSMTLDRRFVYQGKQTKFPGGREAFFQEPFAQILNRELPQEIFLRIKPGASVPKIVHEYIKDNQRKKFFAIPFDALEGELRTFPIYDTMSELFPPYWVDSRDDSYPAKIYKTHQQAYSRLVKHLEEQKVCLAR